MTTVTYIKFKKFDNVRFIITNQKEFHDDNADDNYDAFGGYQINT